MTDMEKAKEWLKKMPGSTAREIDEANGSSGDGAMRKRLNDLKQKGLAEVRGEKKCNVTGKKAQTWFPVNKEEKDDA